MKYPTWSAAVLVALMGACLAVPAQTPESPPAYVAPHQALTPAQLDQLTAPIALYSDPLLGAVLTGATYPLEIVEAARWLDNPSNAALHGDQLSAAMQQQPWDVSVKSLVAFPDVLRNMNANLQWTEQLGDAFLAQQADVMDSVQRLRRQAASAGSLHSSPQQVVTEQDQYLSIQPATPDVIYVPYYDPMVAYGLWPWADYPPVYFGIAPGIVFDGFIGFGIGIGIGFIGPYWGGWGWDWHHHGVYYRPHGPHGGPPRPWNHDPAHRGGVPSRDPGTAARYGGEAARGRDVYRGYERGGPAYHSPNELPRTDMRAPHEGAMAPREGAVAPRQNTPEPRFDRPPPNPPAPHMQPPGQSMPRMQTPAPMMPRMQEPMARPYAPAFQSFGHGPQVRGEAARGQASRAAPPQGGGQRHH